MRKAIIFLLLSLIPLPCFSQSEMLTLDMDKVRIFSFAQGEMNKSMNSPIKISVFHKNESLKLSAYPDSIISIGIFEKIGIEKYTIAIEGYYKKRIFEPDGFNDGPFYEEAPFKIHFSTHSKKPQYILLIP